jgi:hypothetical protein
MKKHVAVFLCLLILFIGMAPILSAATMSKEEVNQYWTNVCKSAKTDADKETSSLLWMGAGCLLNALGLLGAYFIKTPPPAERLIGKPAAYATQYTKCYEQRSTDIMTSNAWLGCGIAAGVEVVGMIVYFVFVASVVTSTLP